MADDTDHSNRILLKSFIRIADGSNDLLFKVSHSADIVDDGEICNIVKKAIDRDVSSQGILFRCSKTFFSDNLTFFCLNLFKFRPTPKGGYLDDLSTFKKYMDQSEPAADDPAVFKEAIDLMGMGIGGDIKIFWNLSEEKIPNTSSDKIR